MEYNRFLTYNEYRKIFFNTFDKIIIGSDLSYDKYIRTTLEYKETFKLYKLYLTRLKNLFKYLNITDSLDIAIICTYFLIPNGYLSLNDKFVRKIENCSNCEFINLLGSKVVTGSGVCRHIVKFLVDLNKMFNNESYFVVLKSVDKNMDHVVLGLNYNNSKFIIDPLNKGLGLVKDNMVTLFDPLKIDMLVNYKLDKSKYKQVSDKLNYLNIGKFYDLDNVSDLDIFKEKYDNMRLKYLYFKELFEEFKVNNYGLFTELSNNIEIITGYQDSNSIKKKVKRK